MFEKLIAILIVAVILNGSVTIAADHEKTAGPKHYLANDTVLPAETEFKKKSEIFKDNHNTFEDAQEPGWIMRFKLKFEDATVTDFNANADIFGDGATTDGTNKPKVFDHYRWPKQDTFFERSFSGGTASTDKSEHSDEPRSTVRCQLTVFGTKGKKPPKEFPAIQINFTDPDDNEMFDYKNQRKFDPKRYRHSLRIKFSGGYADCWNWDEKETHIWKVGEVVDAFGKESLSFYKPPKR